jgi:uncharacterized protein (TIGR02246 family)
MNSDEHEIRQLVTTWIDATKSGDTDSVLSLMADDVVFLVTGQPPMIGKAAFAAAMRAQSGQGRLQFEGKSEIQEVQVLDDWAYMWTKLTVVITPPGAAASIARAGNTLTILKKQNGKWVLARDANMLAVVQGE